MNSRLPILIVAMIVAPSITRAAEPIDVGNRTCLFLDDRFIANQSGFTRTWHQGVPRAEPAIVAEPGAEWPHMFGSVLFDPREKRYKMYYETVYAGTGWIRYAESTDGKTWKKPNLGLFELDGKKDNNIVFAPAELPNVFIDPNATDEKDHFKILAWCRPQKFKGKDVGGLYLFRSADGRDWDPVGPVQLPETTDDSGKARVVLDTNEVIWDELGKQYLGTLRAFPTHPGLPGFVRDEKNSVSYGVIGGHRRAVRVSTSKEITRGWAKSVNALIADAKDDEKATRLSKDPSKLDYCELYIMPAFVYGNHYIGVVSLLFNVDGSDTAEGAGDIQLTFSHDGKAWHRQPDRQTLVANSPANLVPTYSACNPPLQIGDEMWMYYCEANSAHPRTEHTSIIRAAVFRKDGYVSLDASADGSLTTAPVRFTGKSLVLNYETSSDGSVRVALFDENDKPVDGFAAADCDALKGDAVGKKVMWRGKSDLSSIEGKTVKLRIDIAKGKLWSFRFD